MSAVVMLRLFIILKHVYWALRHEYRSVLFRIRIFLVVFKLLGVSCEFS